MAVQFGKSGCSDISVEPFTPICSFDEPKGTTPLSFDVPAVSIAMPVPPAECTCFDFTGSSQSVSVGVAPCGEKGASTFTTTIEKASDDCCDGRYAVKTTGSVSVPCMPFDVEGSTVKVKSKSGSTKADDIDGSIDFWVKKGDGSSCCSLTSGIDVTLPDCIKSYTKPVDPQITYYDKGDQKTHKLVDIAEDKDHCSIYPTVKPITLPACSLADEEKTAKFKVNGTEYRMTLTRKDCAYDIAMPDITVNVPDVVVPNICLGSATFRYTYTYTDEDGATYTTDADSQSASGSFTQDRTGCWSLAVSGLSFDLGSIGGSDFDDTGDVFRETYTTADDKNGTHLVINGDTDAWTDPWYLGGIGTAAGDGTSAGSGTANGWIDLGTLKGAESGTYTGTIPLAKQGHAHYMAKTTTTTTTQAWRSARKGEKQSWNAPLIDFETGDLSAIMMTGAEWSSRGVALRTSNFFYNSSGVLSFVVEAPFDTTTDANGVYSLTDNTSYAPVVAPGIAVATCNEGEKNASGLVVNALADLSSSGLASDVTGLTSGLAVNPGKGLRIHGVTGMASETSTNTKDSLVASDLGKLELLTRSDDFAFTKDGRLGFNDAKTDKQTAGAAADGKFTEFTRGNTAEYVIPIMVPLTGFNGMLATPSDSFTRLTSFCECDDGGSKCCTDRTTSPGCYVDDTYVCSTNTLDTQRNNIAVVYLHVSKSGVILGITKTEGQLADTTGRPTAKAATQTSSSSS